MAVEAAVDAHFGVASSSPRRMVFMVNLSLTYVATLVPMYSVRPLVLTPNIALALYYLD